MALLAVRVLVMVVVAEQSAQAPPPGAQAVG